MEKIKLNEHERFYIENRKIRVKTHTETMDYDVPAGIVSLCAGETKPVMAFIEQGTIWGPGTLTIFNENLARFTMEES